MIDIPTITLIPTIPSSQISAENCNKAAVSKFSKDLGHHYNVMQVLPSPPPPPPQVGAVDLMHLVSWWHSAPWPDCVDRSHASIFMVALNSQACIYGHVSCIHIHGGTQLPGLHIWTGLMHPYSWWHSAPWPACMDRSHASNFKVTLSSLACIYGQLALLCS